MFERHAMNVGDWSNWSALRVAKGVDVDFSLLRGKGSPPIVAVTTGIEGIAKNAVLGHLAAAQTNRDGDFSPLGQVPADREQPDGATEHCLIQMISQACLGRDAGLITNSSSGQREKAYAYVPP